MPTSSNSMPMPPQPMLDGAPPQPPGTQAAPAPGPSLLARDSGMSGMQGSMQIIQMSLQAASQAASLIDLLGQINPGFAPLSQLLIEQLRSGLKSALQQGSSGSEPSSPLLGLGATAAAQQSGVQQPLPAMPSGF